MKRNGGLTFNDRSRKELNVPLVREIAIWLAEIIAVVMVAYMLVMYIGSKTTMVGQSMAPTLEDGQCVLVNKLSYLVFKPKANDVIAFLPNGNERSHYYIKRVIATPGDTLQIKNGEVYVNGEKFDEKVAVDKITEAEMAADEIKLGADEYFVLGDNRNNSEDSRYANIGNIQSEYIIGKVWFIQRPFSDAGLVK